MILGEIATVFFYIFIAVSASLAAYGVSHAPDKGIERLWRFCCFSVLFFPALLRHNIAADYSYYVDIFHNDVSRKNVESGFCWICDLLNGAGFNYLWMFGLVSFATYALLCSVVRKREFFYLITFYILFNGYLLGYGQIRQSLTLPVILQSCYWFFDRKYIKCFTALLLASLFHTSALVFVPLLLLCRLKFDKKVWIILLFTVCPVLLLIPMSWITGLIVMVLPRYARYFVYYDVDAQVSSGLGIIAMLFFPLLLLTVSDSLKKRTVVPLFPVLYIILVFMTLRFELFNRLRDVVWTGLLFSFSDFATWENEDRKYYIAGIFFIGILLYVKSILTSFGVGPMYGPYQTWL